MDERKRNPGQKPGQFNQRALLALVGVQQAPWWQTCIRKDTGTLRMVRAPSNGLDFLLALFPLLLLAGCGVLLQIISPSTDLQIQHTLASTLPGTTGTVLVQGISAHLKTSVGPLLAVGLVAAGIAGSRLFVTLEECFGIIFRLRGRNLLQQNRMTFGITGWGASYRALHLLCRAGPLSRWRAQRA